MIRKESIVSEVDSDDFEGQDLVLDLAQQELVLDILFKQMYRRPIPSIIREYTSNCFDSHIEAKVDEPVLITLDDDEGGNYIIFKDVGIGMSPDRINNIFSKPLKSTKRESNDQIGYFGLGSKSGFSYTNSFYITTISEGICYEYTIYRGKVKFRVDLLTEYATVDHNGTEIKIYIKDDDFSSFLTACGTELVYFDNVYINYVNNPSRFNNEYTVFDYKTFKFRGDFEYSSSLHILLGKVAYPISWEELGIDRIDIPCGLKFNIGDLEVTPERESVRYVDILQDDGSFISTKDIILAKVEAFKAELLALYEENAVLEYEDYEEYKKAVANNKPTIMIGKYTISVGDFMTKPTLIFAPLKNFLGKLPTNLFKSYKIIDRYMKGKKVVRGKVNNYSAVTYAHLTESMCLTPPRSGKYSPKKLAYILDYAEELTDSSEIYIIESPAKLGKRDLANYISNLGLHINFDLNVTNLKEQYKLLHDFISYEFKRLTFNYDDIEPTKEWLEAYRLANTVEVEKEEGAFLVYDYGTNVLNVKRYVLPEELLDHKAFILYGFEEDEDIIKDFKILLTNSMYASTQNYTLNSSLCALYKTAKRNEKHFLNISNAFYIYDFMGDNKIFRRFATAAMIEKESAAIGMTGHLASNVAPCINFTTAMESIFPPVSDTLLDLRAACKDFGSLKRNELPNQVFIQELVKVAKEYNLYDTDMHDAHVRLEGYVKGLGLVNNIVITDDILHYLVEYLRLKNKKVDTLWTAPTNYEKALVRESEEKCVYLASVYEGAKTHYAKKYKSTFTSRYEALLLKLKKNRSLFTNLNKFYDNNTKIAN